MSIARRRRQRGAITPARRIGIILVAVLWLAPVAWIIATAFKSPAQVLSLDLLFEPTLRNFATAFGPQYRLGSRLLNSIAVTALTLLVALPVATASAYALSRYRFPGGSIWSIAILATQFVPAAVIIIPLFITFRGFGLIDSWAALVIVNLSFVLPYATWMIKGFIDALPPDMEEAAAIDGATRIRTIFDVVVPVIIPGVATAAIFSFVIAWNEFFYALILTRGEATTLPVALMSARTEQGDAWEIMATIGLVIIGPMLLISRLVQRFFVRGLTAGSVR
jgi:ABC-type glycerol-3-phosphate transport system permease component